MERAVGARCGPNDTFESQLQAALFSGGFHRSVSRGERRVKSMFWCQPQACSMADRAHPGLRGSSGRRSIDETGDLSHRIDWIVGAKGWRARASLLAVCAVTLDLRFRLVQQS